MSQHLTLGTPKRFVDAVVPAVVMLTMATLLLVAIVTMSRVPVTDRAPQPLPAPGPMAVAVTSALLAGARQGA